MQFVLVLAVFRSSSLCALAASAQFASLRRSEVREQRLAKCNAVVCAEAQDCSFLRTATLDFGRVVCHACFGHLGYFAMRSGAQLPTSSANCWNRAGFRPLLFGWLTRFRRSASVIDSPGATLCAGHRLREPPGAWRVGRSGCMAQVGDGLGWLGGKIEAVSA